MIAGSLRGGADGAEAIDSRGAAAGKRSGMAKAVYLYLTIVAQRN